MPASARHDAGFPEIETGASAKRSAPGTRRPTNRTRHRSLTGRNRGYYSDEPNAV